MPWEGDVTVQVGTQRVLCEGCDISESGMQVVGDWGAYPGQSVTLKFELNGHAVHAFGTVEWATIADIDHIWGIRFTALHPRVRKRIAKLVERHLNTPVEPIQLNGDGEPQPVWSEHPTPVGFEGALFEPDALEDLEQYVDTNRMFAEPSSISADGERPEPPSIAEAPVLPPVVPVRTGETVRVSIDEIAGRPDPGMSTNTALRLQHRQKVEHVLRHLSDAHQGAAVQATPGRRHSRGGTVER